MLYQFLKKIISFEYYLLIIYTIRAFSEII